MSTRNTSLVFLAQPFYSIAYCFRLCVTSIPYKLSAIARAHATSQRTDRTDALCALCPSPYCRKHKKVEAFHLFTTQNVNQQIQIELFILLP